MRWQCSRMRAHAQRMGNNPALGRRSPTMAEDPTKETTEDLLVRLLCSTLDNKAQDNAKRVDAAIYLLGYFARERAGSSIDSARRAKAAAMAASVKSSLTTIALDDEVELDVRLRAAGAAL